MSRLVQPSAAERTILMRSISTRFLLVVGLFALVFSAVLLYHTWSAIQAQQEARIAHESQLALEFDRAIRQYVREKIRPEMAKRLQPGEFVPEAMSTSFVARSIFERVHLRMPEYIIKFASDHPRNPANQASPEEQRQIEYFEQHPEVSRLQRHLELGGKPYYAQLSPMWIERDCLECHGRPEDAPASLVARYGPTAGFHRRLGDLAGVDTIAVPLEQAEAARLAQTAAQSAIIVIWLALLFGAVVIIYRAFVGDRLRRLATQLQQAAQQPEATVPSVPVDGQDEIGVLARSFNTLAERLRQFHTSLEELVTQRTAALQAEIAERKRAEAALQNEQRLLRQLLEIQERQQTQVATEIHDALTQPLTGVLMSLDCSRQGVQGGQLPNLLGSLDRARELVSETLNHSRRLMSGLRPSILDDLGPVAALESLILESEVTGKQKIQLNAPPDLGRFSPALETALFRIVQECLRNAQQHSQSSQVRITLAPHGPHLRVEVEDWGIGFNPDQVPPNCFGLEGTRKRVRLLGGTMEIASTPGQGTRVTIELPVEAASPDGSQEAELNEPCLES